MDCYKKIFFSLFFNDLLSDFGDSLYYLALMNYILLLPDSRLALAAITISETLPIFFKAFTGYWADKIRYKVNAIILTQIARFLIYIFVGILISFNPALWIILIISLLNLLSDLAGQFENGLYLPIELQLIQEKEREQIFATTQSIASSLNIIFKLCGAILVTWFSYQSLALINASTFLICAIFMFFLKSYLTPLQKMNVLSNEKGTEENSSKSFWMTLKKAHEELNSIPGLIEFLIVITCINGLFSIISPLIVASISQNHSFIIINSASTISFFSVILAVSSILGNIAINTVFNSLSLKFLLYMAITILPLLFLSFISQNILLCFLLLGGLGITSGGASPKFYGFLMSKLPSEKIGLFTGGIGTIMQIGTILAQISFSLLLISVPVQTIIWIYLFASITLIVILIIQKLFKKQRNLL